MIIPRRGAWPPAHVLQVPSAEDANVTRVHLRRNGITFVGLRLLWSTWCEMCDFVDVGTDEHQPTGVYVDVNGIPCTAVTNHIGLCIPFAGSRGAMFAAEGDWIVRAESGVIFPVKPERLEHLFDVVELLHV